MNAVRCGFKSRAEVVSELGYDVEEIDTEIAADNARADAMNLHFDSDSREKISIKKEEKWEEKGEENDAEIYE